MVYALRRVSSVILRLENWDAFEAQLCLVAAAHPVTLQWITKLLATYSRLGFPIGKERVSRLVNSLIAEHAPLEHHSEVAWCLWICKELTLRISTANVDAVAAMESSICALILLDLDSTGSLPKTLAYSHWRRFETSSALWEEQWMLSYEAGVRGWGGMSDTHVKADTYFDELRKLQVRFYDTEALITPLITPKVNALERHNFNTVAQLLELEDLDDVFEYEDEEDAYGGPIEREEEDDF